MFILAKGRNGNKCLFTKACSNKFWFIHTTTIEKDELELYLMTLQGFYEQLWSKKDHIQNTAYFIIPFLKQ